MILKKYYFAKYVIIAMLLKRIYLFKYILKQFHIKYKFSQNKMGGHINKIPLAMSK